MGLGRDPEDVVTAIKLGADIFDCVVPTRMARNGTLYSGKLTSSFKFKSKFKKGRLNIGNKSFKKDFKAIEKNCDCYTCKTGFNRAYLHHLYKTKELLYYRLASIHNLKFMIKLCEEARSLILKI